MNLNLAPKNFGVAPPIDDVFQFRLAHDTIPASARIQFTFRCLWRWLVAFRRYSRSSPKVVRNRAEISMFLGEIGSPNCGRMGHQTFWPNFINLAHYLGHHRTCGKVWWRSAKRPRRLGGEKKKEDLNYSGKTEWPAGGHNKTSLTNVSHLSHRQRRNNNGRCLATKNSS